MARRIHGVAVLALLVCVPAAHAQERTGSFEKLKPSQWSQLYRAMQRLEGDGLPTGSPRGTFDGRRALSRYEFATALERMFRGMQTSVLGASDVARRQRDLEDLTALLDQFSADLAQLGLDPADLQNQIKSVDERLKRIEKTSPPAAPADSLRTLSNRHGFGFRNAFSRLRDPDPFGLVDRSALPASLRAPIGVLEHPALTADVGPAQVGVDVQKPDSLDTAGPVPFENPADALSYRAQLALPFGSYSLSAFYGRDNGRNDRYGAYSPFFRNQITENVGGALSGKVTSRMAFRLETARARPLDDALSSMVYFRGGLKYALGRGFSVDVGFERNRLFSGPGEFQDETAYTMKLGREVGRNARLDLLLRLSGMSGSNTSALSGRDFGDSSAVTQLTVKF